MTQLTERLTSRISKSRWHSKKCNPKPFTIQTDGKHTIPAQSTRIIHASVPVSSDHPVTVTVYPLPQFDECAKLIVAPAITTAREKRVAIKIANTMEFSAHDKRRH